MDRDTELQIVRRAYAKQVVAAGGVADRRVEAAFAIVRREDFLGRGPWPILRWDRCYVPTPSPNPVYLYADVLVGILPERNLNNGQPSFLAALIAGGLTAAITSTRALTSSVARAGSLSILPSASRASIARFWPSMYPSSRRPWNKGS